MEPQREKDMTLEYIATQFDRMNEEHAMFGASNEIIDVNDDGFK